MSENVIQGLTKQQMRQIALSATTLGEIKDARALLEQWETLYPEEPKMHDAWEQLYALEDALRFLDAQSTGRVA